MEEARDKLTGPHLALSGLAPHVTEVSLRQKLLGVTRVVVATCPSTGMCTGNAQVEFSDARRMSEAYYTWTQQLRLPACVGQGGRLLSEADVVRALSDDVARLAGSGPFAGSALDALLGFVPGVSEAEAARLGWDMARLARSLSAALASLNRRQLPCNCDGDCLIGRELVASQSALYDPCADRVYPFHIRAVPGYIFCERVARACNFYEGPATLQGTQVIDIWAN